MMTLSDEEKKELDKVLENMEPMFLNIKESNENEDFADTKRAVEMYILRLKYILDKFAEKYPDCGNNLPYYYGQYSAQCTAANLLHTLISEGTGAFLANVRNLLIFPLFNSVFSEWQREKIEEELNGLGD